MVRWRDGCRYDQFLATRGHLVKHSEYCVSDSDVAVCRDAAQSVALRRHVAFYARREFSRLALSALIEDPDALVIKRLRQAEE